MLLEWTDDHDSDSTAARHYPPRPDTVEDNHEEAAAAGPDSEEMDNLIRELQDARKRVLRTDAEGSRDAAWESTWQLGASGVLLASLATS